MKNNLNNTKEVTRKKRFIYTASWLGIAWIVLLFASSLFSGIVSYRYGGRRAVRESDGYYAIASYTGKKTKISKTGFNLIHLSDSIGDLTLQLVFVVIVLIWVSWQTEAALTPEERKRIGLPARNPANLGQAAAIREEEWAEARRQQKQRANETEQKSNDHDSPSPWSS